MAELTTKACNICGTNLNGQKRVKNAAGEYFCPECWKTSQEIFGDVYDMTSAPSPLQSTTAPPSTQPQSLKPVVKVVRSELSPTLGQAVIQGAKKGAISGLVRQGAKLVVFLVLIAALAVTKKLFPDLRNGPMAIITVTSVLVGIVIVELLARAVNFGPLWMDADILKSRVGILVMI